MAAPGWPSRAIFDWLHDVLFERFGIPFAFELSLPYLQVSVPGSAVSLRFVVDGQTFNRTDSDLPCAQWPARQEGWNPVFLDTLVAPGAAQLPAPLVTRDDQGVVVHYDLFGFVYWMLARCEEVNPAVRDEHGRFAARQSNAFKNDYLQRPLVDEWLALFLQIAQRQWPELVAKQLEYSIKVSHDVDEPSRYAFRSASRLLRAAGGDLLKRGDLKAALRGPLIKLGSRRQISPMDPSNTFDWLMDQSERHGLVSAFYFICGRTDPARDSDYELEHPAIRALLRSIHERGHEIGLHPSYNTYLSPPELVKEAQRLRTVCAEEGIFQPAWGGRMHYLRWQHPATLHAWEQAGMAYDSTLGYADLPGFRCGTCHEYPAFDSVTQQRLALRIRPLVVMDVTLISSSYLGLEPGEEARQLVEGLKSACRAVRGCFTLLWHNSNFLRAEERSFYASLLG